MKIVVIGGGPGGYVAAIRAAQLGADVTLIEKDSLGGTCLNVGCIPTKALLESAHVYHNAKHSLDIGIEANPILHWDKVQKRRQTVIDTLVSGVNGLMKANKIKVIKGVGSFKSEKEVVIKATGEVIAFDKCIIATGSVPAKPPINGIDSPCCIDSTDVLALDKVPQSMVIVGGGVIGIEFACCYNAFGTKITIVEMADSILPTMDRELAIKLRKYLESTGIEILTGAKVEKISPSNNGGVCEVTHNNDKKKIAGEKVLVCSGRRPYTDGLDLEKSGVKVDRVIQVDNKMRTSNPNIFAIGDCNAKLMLAHAASEQGVIAVENAMGADNIYDDAVCPAGVYSFPEFAGVGITEETAKQKGIEYIVSVFPTMANGRSIIHRETIGCVKVIAGKKHKEILGVHILGESATELIAESALAMKLECTVDEIIETIHAHPTLSECLHEASLGIEKRMLHMPNKK
ncbi:dihydrolipoyl dehydrogenase [Candidatus Epulonipiscium fishelsonii]|uniref:Dihydrolipoyl dehydrogenase n=1 Tax=Candidatus Epulonipiscium fishelsonii TaxID=77094 RepID=A0ACC8XAD4_9FIRM|nr:dihydrolipoyl dehydrogenase [Epulopiscium sp. SCG-B11WGA-EpuloA1]